MTPPAQNDASSLKIILCWTCLSGHRLWYKPLWREHAFSELNPWSLVVLSASMWITFVAWIDSCNFFYDLCRWYLLFWKWKSLLFFSSFLGPAWLNSQMLLFSLFRQLTLHSTARIQSRAAGSVFDVLSSQYELVHVICHNYLVKSSRNIKFGMLALI